jgi:hypothetical protein
MARGLRHSLDMDIKKPVLQYPCPYIRALTIPATETQILISIEYEQVEICWLKLTEGRTQDTKH